MTIKSSGQLSFGEIMNEFGWYADPNYRLGQYYRAGPYVPNIPANYNISTSGQISIGMFYGSKKVVPIVNRLINQAFFSIDLMYYFNFYLLDGATGLYVYENYQIQVGWSTFGHTGNTREWNYSTGAGAAYVSGYHDVTTLVSMEPNPDYNQPPLYSQEQFIYTYQTTSYPDFTQLGSSGDRFWSTDGGYGAILTGSGYYTIGMDATRNYIYPDGLGKACYVPDPSAYSNISISVGSYYLGPSGRVVVYGLTQPTAANGWVGQVICYDGPTNNAAAQLYVYLNAS